MNVTEFTNEVDRRYKEQYGEGPETIEKRIVSHELMVELSEE